MSYWDTSCLVKLYVSEPDSPALLAHASARPVPPTISEIGSAEMWATLRRKESDGVLPPGEAQRIHQTYRRHVALGLVNVIALDAQVHAEFITIVDRCHQNIPRLPVRTLDALHLASALVAGETEIVTTDKHLRAAASFLGFSVFPFMRSS